MEPIDSQFLIDFGVSPDCVGTLAGKYPITYSHTDFPPGNLKRISADYFEIFCPTRPVDIYEISGSTKRKNFRYRIGFVAFNPPNRTWHAQWKSRIEGLSLYIQPQIIDDICQQTFGESVETNQWRLVLGDYVPSIAYLALDIGSQAATGYPAGVKFVEQQTATLLSMLVRRYSVTKTRDTSMVGVHSAVVLRAVQYINQNLQNKISVDSIAIAAAASPPHLNRLFRAELGISVWTYVQRRKLNAMVQEIESSNVSIKVIAKKFGYSSFSSANKAHEKIFGQPVLLDTLRPRNYL